MPLTRSRAPGRVRGREPIGGSGRKTSRRIAGGRIAGGRDPNAGANAGRRVRRSARLTGHKPGGIAAPADAGEASDLSIKNVPSGGDASGGIGTGMASGSSSEGEEGAGRAGAEGGDRGVDWMEDVCEDEGEGSGSEELGRRHTRGCRRAALSRSAGPSRRGRGVRARAAGAGRRRQRELIRDDSDSDDSDYAPEPSEEEDVEDEEDAKVMKVMGAVGRAWGRAGEARDVVDLVSRDSDSDGTVDEVPLAARAVVRTKGDVSGRSKRSRQSRADKRQKKRRCWSPEKPEIFENGYISGDLDLDPEALGWSKSKEQMEPSSELLMPLLPFQKEFLAWAVKQGMGKTIQAIAVILANPIVPARGLKTPKHQLAAMSKPGCPSQPLAMDRSPAMCVPISESLPTTPPAYTAGMARVLDDVAVSACCGTTLVVCPLVAVIQWRQEIARFTTPGALKVLIYHGPKRTTSQAELEEADVVLTTYSILENEYRKSEMPSKVQCRYCGKKFYPDRLKVHLRYFCGPNAVKSTALAKQKRKTVSKTKTIPSRKGMASSSKGFHLGCESAEEAGMMGGSVKDLPPNLRHLFDEGRMWAHEQDALDMILEATRDKGEDFGKRSGSLLHRICWCRIVLDEAHSIKERRCNTAHAAFALKSKYKWALSGTPLQNRVAELYSLIRFIRTYPYSYYFCRKCDCKCIDYPFKSNSRQCRTCGHSPLHHFCWWNKYVANPIKRYGYSSAGKLAMAVLKTEILDRTLLRRTKVQCADDLALPPRTVVLRKDRFDDREVDFYEALYTQSQAQFDAYVKSGTLVNNYAHIFDLLIRLRQAVDHPYLVIHSSSQAHATEVGEAGRQGEEENARGMCGVCHDPVEDGVTSTCKHVFCRQCIVEFIDGGGEQVTCPVCQRPLSVDLSGAHPSLPKSALNAKEASILSRINTADFQSSTKIEALREELFRMRQEDPSSKAIVFSQFTKMLELLHFRLEQVGLKCAKLDGSMSMDVRDRMITNFTEDPDVVVFLMSLKAGGVALNLTAASHVMLMDPWWNPAVEQQAQDRIHRLGQYKPIRVTRFIIAGTIEERILKLQEKKQLVFEGTVGRDAEALGRLTADDLCFLFG